MLSVSRLASSRGRGRGRGRARAPGGMARPLASRPVRGRVCAPRARSRGASRGLALAGPGSALSALSPATRN